jgi:hypothetical protein
MSNRRFEMHPYRQIIARMRLGETDRSIARAGLMGRKKAGRIRDIAEARGWLNKETPLPEEAVLANAFLRKPVEPGQGSPWFCPMPRTSRSGISRASRERPFMRPWFDSTALPAVTRLYGGSCRASRTSPKATVILDFEPGEAAQVDFGSGPRITDVFTGECDLDLVLCHEPGLEPSSIRRDRHQPEDTNLAGVPSPGY